MLRLRKMIDGEQWEIGIKGVANLIIKEVLWKLQSEGEEWEEEFSQVHGSMTSRYGSLCEQSSTPMKPRVSSSLIS